MKLLRTGTPPPKHSWVGRYLCPACASIIDLEDEDEADVKVEQQKGGNVVKTKCPVCDRVRSLVPYSGEADPLVDNPVVAP